MKTVTIEQLEKMLPGYEFNINTGRLENGGSFFSMKIFENMSLSQAYGFLLFHFNYYKKHCLEE